MNAEVLTNYSNICSDTAEVKEEIVLHSMEHTPYIYDSSQYPMLKARFKLIKFMQRQKSRSLRTEMDINIC